MSAGYFEDSHTNLEFLFAAAAGFEIGVWATSFENSTGFRSSAEREVLNLDSHKVCE